MVGKCGVKVGEVQGGEEGGEGGVELGAGATEEFGEDGFAGAGGAISAVRTHGIEGVGEPQNAGYERNLLADEAIGIALAVPAFMMVKDGGQHAGHLRNAVEDGVADAGVLLNFGEFFLGEAAGFAEDRFGNADFSHIMDHSGEAKEFDLFVGEVERAGHGGGEYADAFGVAAGVGVLGVDGGGERVDGAEEELSLVGEAGDVFVEDANEVGDGVAELHFNGGEIGVVAALVSGHKNTDDIAVVDDGLGENLAGELGRQRMDAGREDAGPAVGVPGGEHFCGGGVDEGGVAGDAAVGEGASREGGGDGGDIAEFDGYPAEREDGVDVRDQHANELLGFVNVVEEAGEAEEEIDLFVSLGEFAAELVDGVALPGGESEVGLHPREGEGEVIGSVVEVAEEGGHIGDGGVEGHIGVGADFGEAG